MDVTRNNNDHDNRHGDDRSHDNHEREWISLGEAARRLGVTRAAIYGRMKRGTIETRPRGNRGHEIAWPIASDDNDNRFNDDYQNDQPDDNRDETVALKVEIARLEERLVGAGRIEDELRQHIGEKDARISALEDEVNDLRRPWWHKLFGSRYT